MANDRGKMLGAALAGIIAGAVAGILLAPKSGKETREDLARIGERMKNDISNRVKKLSAISSTAYAEIVDTVLNQYQETKEITAEQAQNLRRELMESYQKIKQAAAEAEQEAAEAEPEQPSRPSRERAR